MTRTSLLAVCLWPLLTLCSARAQELLPPVPSPSLSGAAPSLDLRDRPPNEEGAELFRTSANPPVEGTATAAATAIAPLASEREPFHWKGLLLQSLAFQGVEHGPRIAAADQEDRHLLLNKPFWSDYWASLGQFNMGRWNDGDSFVVNYLGHPMQGAVSGYIEVQNDPRGRDLEFANTSRYWNSRFRSFLWQTAYSTEFEIGPISETSIFNQGGYTYPLNCKANDAACEKTAKYTNNTGWVDFIVTPVGGTVMQVGGDLIDRYISDRLIAKHPDRFRYLILRGSLNPPRSMANMLRGKYPWYRDYDAANQRASRANGSAPVQEGEKGAAVELHPFVSSVSLPDNQRPCRGCRRRASGPGGEVGVRVGRYLQAVSAIRSLSQAGALFPTRFGGSLLLAHFGLRTGVASPRFAMGISLMPGFASYSQTLETTGSSEARRSFLFSAQAGASGEVRLTRRVGLRATVEQIVIRYKSDQRDPPGIGTPPRLSFLSHDNYINQTNWGVRVGPVLRF